MDPPVLLLLLLFSSGTWAQNSGAHTECSLSEEEHSDVMLLLDGFNHISPDDFSRVRDFLKTLLPMVGPVGPDLVRVSLVKCGRDPEVEFYLNTFHNLSSMVDAVSRVSQSPSLSGGSTDNAVKFIERTIMQTGRGDRWKTPNILILVTDRSSSGVDTDLLDYLWNNAVKVFVVGVKVTDELQVSESDGDGAEVFTVEDYNSISNICEELAQSMCRWFKQKLSQVQPESLRFTDVQPRRLRASWECNSRRVQSFDLFVDLVHPESFVQRIFVLGHERSAEILHLLPKTSYKISVYAEYSTGYSDPETGVLTTPQDGLRLSAGPGRCSGSVEVLMDGSWSSVCRRDFGLTEAAVVCAELDCGAVSERHQGALFTEGPAVGRSFHCDGPETSLKECESSETRCSAAAHLTCSDEVLRLDGFSCAGLMELRHSDEWRPVMTSEDLDLDFGSVLCEQMGCGSALEVKYKSDLPGPFWWLQPECVKQRSGLTNCLDLDSHMNKTKGRLLLTCSEFVPTVRASVSSEGASVSSEGTSVSSEGASVSSEGASVSSEGASVSSEGASVSSEGASVSSEGASVSSEGASVSSEGASVSSEGASVSSEGASVSSEGASRVQRVLLVLRTTFSVSCSLDEPFLPGQFHLLSPTGNYTLPSVNHSAHFLFQDFSPAHIGNTYTCVYCGTVYFKRCIKSSTLYVTPGAPLSHKLIRATVYVVTLTLWALAMFLYYKRCRRQRKPIRRAHHVTFSTEDNTVQMITL